MKPASLSHIHAPFRRAMRPTTLLATALALCGAASVQALPVIPGAAGFGMDTKAGRGGTVYKVTNLNADGAGSLKACIDASGPRTCVFEVSGAIRITSDLTIRNGQLRIAGQTAPSPGIMIRGAAIKITASDVLIQHIRVRTGRRPQRSGSRQSRFAQDRGHRCEAGAATWSSITARSAGPSTKSRAPGVPTTTSLSPTTSSPSRSTSRCIRNTTARARCRMATACCSAQSDDSSITFVGNLMAHIVERNPLSRAAELVMVNNLVYNRGTMDLDLQSQDGRVTKSSVVGNVFLRGPSFSRATKPILHAHQRRRIRCCPAVACMSTTTRAPDSGSSYSSW